MATKKPKTVSKLKKEADAAFSRYIRLRYADHTGYVSCVTCNVSKPVAEMQAGHYWKRSINELRFDEQNVHPQCVGCNVFGSGNYPRYASYMFSRYGAGVMEDLEKRSGFTRQFKPFELEALIELYKAKTKNLTTLNQ